MTTRGNKFGAVKTVLDGITFDSQKEARRYAELRLLEKEGQISHLECHPRIKLYCGNEPILMRSPGYPNGRHAVYEADFAYFDGRARVIEDVKSKATKTPSYKLKKAIVEAMRPGVRIVEV